MRTYEMPFPTTRGALEQTLDALGFTSTLGTNAFGSPFLTFENSACAAVILLRAVPPEQPLDAGDLLVAARTVEGRGVADAETFHRLLREATRAKAQVA